MNVVVLQGNLCADPGLFRTRSGRPKLVFKLAVDRAPGRPAKRTNGAQRGADYVPVVSYGEVARQAYPHLRRGSAVVVEGFYQTRDLNRNGHKPRTVSEVVAERIILVADGGTPSR